MFDWSKYVSVDGLEKGVYVLVDSDGMFDVILIVIGSEVLLVIDVYEKLVVDGVKSWVVLMLSWYCYEL